MVYRALLRPWFLVLFLVLLTLYFHISSPAEQDGRPPSLKFVRPPLAEGEFAWRNIKQQHPVTEWIRMPRGRPEKIPRIQFDFSAREKKKNRKKLSPHEVGEQRRNEDRLAAAKRTFERSWRGYRNFAWGRDSLLSVSKGAANELGGWGATLVDSLDTLWIMGFKPEFEEAVEACRRINFTTFGGDVVNLFESNIRILGGFLGAYDLSEGQYPVLLEKAVELGDFLYAAFDTENRIPVTRWPWKRTKAGEPQVPLTDMLVAELGSMTLEFTRLTQLSGDPKFFDAVQRISDLLERQQEQTRLPGMWPVVVDGKNAAFNFHDAFTLGSMADMSYEYLPKQYLQLGGRSHQSRKMYERAISVAKRHTIYKPMTKDNREILFPGLTRVVSSDALQINPQVQHLDCYVGGMIGLASRIFNLPEDLPIARKLVDGCIWASQIQPSGVMPESFYVVPCQSAKDMECSWDEKVWHAGIKSMAEHLHLNDTGVLEKIITSKLPPGIIDYSDTRYLLRAEVIESIFILYRITGDQALRDAAWDLFESIEKGTKTPYGSSAVPDIRNMTEKADGMESFWTGSTLKYFYLTFSDPDLVSLDEFVFNSASHPFRRPSR